MWATRIRLLGASAPNNRDGTISGKPSAAVATAVVRMKSRRERDEDLEERLCIFIGMFDGEHVDTTGVGREGEDCPCSFSFWTLTAA